MLDHQEIKSSMQDQAGVRALQEALDQAQDPELLQEKLANYVQFNAVFGSAVASLAGSIGPRFDLFENPIAIAAKVFAAAIDEHGGKDAHGPTHRDLALKFENGIAGFFHLESHFIVAGQIFPFKDKVLNGYDKRRQAGAWDLCHALGFHIGSEVLADKEFGVIDQSLRRRFPKLVTELRAQRKYAWIRIHAGDDSRSGVEDEHAVLAVEAANLAVESCLNPDLRSELPRAIQFGINSFADLQNRFMQTLLTSG